MRALINTGPRVMEYVTDWPKPEPGPDDLRRRNGIRTAPVELGDGRAWAVPIATLQPTIRRVGPDGTWRDDRDPRYAKLWRLAERLRENAWEPVNAAFDDGVGLRREMER